MPDLRRFTLPLWLLLAWTLGGCQSTHQVIESESGLRIEIQQRGSGPSLREGQVVILHYVGTLADGKEFDSSRKRNQPFAFMLGKRQVIKGYEEGFKHLRVGDKAVLTIPPYLAYGEKGRPSIPPNSTLRFQVEVLSAADHSLSDAVSAAVEKGGIVAGRQRLEELKARGFPDHHVSESQMNGLGYRYLGKGQVAEALAVFGWNVDLFPQSANAVDSLAEGLAKQGDAERAAETCRRAFSLDAGLRIAPGSWCAKQTANAGPKT